MRQSGVEPPHSEKSEGKSRRFAKGAILRYRVKGSERTLEESTGCDTHQNPA
jgi:hypothetical protein